MSLTERERQPRPVISHQAVFLNSIAQTGPTGIIAEASNGSPDGPPFVRFQLTSQQARDAYIGKKYYIEITTDPPDR